MAELVGDRYRILSDSRQRVAKGYGVFNLLDDGLAAPAVFVIDPAGTVRYSYIGQNINDRPTVADLLAAVAAAQP